MFVSELLRPDSPAERSQSSPQVRRLFNRPLSCSGKFRNRLDTGIRSSRNQDLGPDFFSESHELARGRRATSMPETPAERWVSGRLMSRATHPGSAPSRTVLSDLRRRMGSWISTDRDFNPQQHRRDLGGCQISQHKFRRQICPKTFVRSSLV